MSIIFWEKTKKKEKDLIETENKREEKKEWLRQFLLACLGEENEKQRLLLSGAKYIFFGLSCNVYLFF